MKKYNVFKVLVIAMLAAIAISFLIPQSTIGYTGIEKGKINPITLIDLLSNGLTSLSVFVEAFVYILMIGVFYSVVKKTGKYEAVINNTAVKFKNNRKVFAIVSILTFGLLTAVIGNVLPMLIFAPAFVDVAKELKYNSKKAVLSTVGAIIIGNAGSLYTIYANQMLGLKISANIIAKLIILVVSLTALILFVVLGEKTKQVRLEKEEVKKGLPLSIVFDIILALLIVGMVPWNAYFGFEGFDNFHKAITEFKVFDVSLFTSVVGKSITAFGTWTIYSLSIVLAIASIVIAFIYKIKIDGYFEAVANGIKKSISYALIYVFSNVILISVYSSGFFTTVITSVGKMKDSILSSSTVSALSSLVYPDYAYASQFTIQTLASTLSNTAIFKVLALIFQSMYSLLLLVSPTSILLLMALRYENISYKNWIKYIYKFFIGLLIVYFMIIMIVGGKYVKTISYVVLAVLVVILVLFFVLCKGKKEEIKVEVKEEPKKEVTKKTSSSKKTSSKKTTTKKK